VDRQHCESDCSGNKNNNNNNNNINNNINNIINNNNNIIVINNNSNNNNSTAMSTTFTGSSRASRTILRVSGAADSFHRVSSSRSSSDSRSVSPVPLSQRGRRTMNRGLSTEESIDVEYDGPIHGNANTNTNADTNTNNANTNTNNTNTNTNTNANTNAPNSQNIDRPLGGLPQIAGRGCHMPPEVLGQAEETASKANGNSNSNHASIQGSESNAKKTATLAKLNKAARRRSLLAVKAIKSAAATKAAKAAAKGVVTTVALNSSMFATILYGGMEVVFSYVASHHAVAGVCSRTNFLFQKLDLASESRVVSMTSNFSTGMLVVTHEDGIIQTYMPAPTDLVAVDGPQTQTQQRPKSVFGRYRWIDSVTIDAAEVFYNNESGEERIVIKFCDRRQRKPGEIVDVSVSYDGTLLVAHRQQLAVFKALPGPGPLNAGDGNDNDNDNGNDNGNGNDNDNDKDNDDRSVDAVVLVAVAVDCHRSGAVLPESHHAAQVLPGCFCSAERVDANATLCLVPGKWKRSKQKERQQPK